MDDSSNEDEPLRDKDKPDNIMTFIEYQSEVQKEAFI